MVRDIHRRTFLKGAAVSGTVGFAGCLGGGGSGNGDGNGGNGNGNGAGSGNGDGNGGSGTGTDDGSGSGGTDREVKFGVLMPETGDLGSLGVTMRDGALLVQRQLESEGANVTLDVQTGDTQTDPQAGISAANQLVNAGYPAIVGPAASNVNMQVTQNVLIPNGVVGMSPSSTSPAVTGLDDDDFIFRTCPSDALQGPVISQVAQDRLDASTAATLYLNDDYGQALQERFVSAFQESGGEVTNQVSFEPEQPSYSSQLGEALSGDPDALVIVAFPQSGIQMFRDYYSDHDTGVDIIVTDGLRDAGLPSEVGNPMDNVIGTAPMSAGQGAEFFNQLYKDEYDREPTVFNGQSYDAAAVLTLANIAAGENDGAAIRDQIRTVTGEGGEEVGPKNLADAVDLVSNGDEINYQGASSNIEFDDNGDIVAVTYEVFAFAEDGIETVDTIDYQA